MQYLELGLEMLLEQVVLRPSETAACLKDNAAGELPLMSGTRRRLTTDQKALLGALERATGLTKEATEEKFELL